MLLTQLWYLFLLSRSVLEDREEVSFVLGGLYIRRPQILPEEEGWQLIQQTKPRASPNSGHV